MAFEHKDNSWSLFISKRKREAIDKARQAGDSRAEQQAEGRPDYDGRGKIKCPGCGLAHEVDMAGWMKEAKSGVKYLSGTISQPRDAGGGESEQPPRQDQNAGWPGGEQRATGGGRSGPAESTPGMTEDDLPF